MNGQLERHPAARRLGRLLWWIAPLAAPLAALLWLYRYSLLTWFQQDDFAWLGLNLSVHNWADLWRTLTEPMAQGTLRILSERALFMSLYALFGLDAMPFRVVVFATAAGVLLLMAAVTRRITGDRTAGLLAPLLWLANSNIAVALSWNSSYNQIQCAFFLLAALYTRLRWVETGRRRWSVLEWAAFLAGFGALELNVVYPAIAVAHALFVAPRQLRRRLLVSTVPMFAVSLGYAVLHRALAPPQTSATYRLYWDLRIFDTLWTYWSWALGPARYTLLRPLPDWLVLAGTLALTAGLAAFALLEARARRYHAGFFLAWYFIVLAPLVPLREHITEYYLTIPTVGLAMWGGAALAWNFGERSFKMKALAKKGLALALLLIYVLTSVPVARTASRWWYERGRRVRGLVMGVERAHELHPAKAILLAGVDDALFWSGVYDRPFRLLGISAVYLAPDAGTPIRPLSDAAIGDYILPAAVARRLLQGDQAVVYDASAERLRNVTSRYRDVVSLSWPEDLPRQVDVGSAWYAEQLGASWYGVEDGYRWMPARATLRLGGPKSAGERLYVTGYCARELLVNGFVPVTVKVNDRLVASETLTRPGRFDIQAGLPPGLVGVAEVEVEIEAGRTFRPPGDRRELGLAFGVVAIR